MDIDVSDVLNTEWGEPLSIKEFIQHHRLPQIVKIFECENKRFQIPGNINLQHPILLYKVYSCRKIHGRAVSVDAKGRMTPNGPSLIIPETYTGWLSVVTKDGKTAGYFSTIGEVARAAVPIFLVRSAVVGLKPTPVGMCCIVVPAGEVLKSLGPYEDLNRQIAVQANNGNIRPDYMMYLKCTNQQGDISYLPYNTRGQFYCIASAKSHSVNHVFLISNLLRVSNLPILINIVSGNKPTTTPPFTNTVQLEEVRNETIILGCTMVENKPILLEINANSAFSLIKAMDEKLIHRSYTYRRMCFMCTTEGDRWRKEIRVAYHVVPKKLTAQAKARYFQSDSQSVANHMRKIASKPEKNEEVAQLKDMKRFSPGSTLLSFLKYAYQSHIFPRTFWMFGQTRNREVVDASFRLDILKTYCSKYKGKKCLTLKIRAMKHLSKAESKILKYRSNTDETSYLDNESIYHSIC